MSIEAMKDAQPAVPEGYKLVPVDALIRRRDAFAAELEAWDIDPPLHHVQTSHDEIDNMTSGLTTPPAAQPCPYIRSTAEGTHHCALSQRQWVGLTDEEISELWAVSRAAVPRYATYASLVEAKLRSKNT